MGDATTSDAPIERRSLEIGKWGNLLMAVAGVVASFLSHSDALLVDGLYSGVNFVSAILAAKITTVVARPADRRYPFGYDAHEALYVTFRSLGPRLAVLDRTLLFTSPRPRARRSAATWSRRPREDRRACGHPSRFCPAAQRDYSPGA